MQPSAVIVEKIKHKHSQKKEQFSSSVPHECPASVQPATRVYPTPCHVGRGLAGHPRSVRVGYGDNKTRLFTPIRSKTPAFQRRGLHLGARRERSHSTLRGDDVAGKRSHRNGSSSFERVRLLQPLLPRPQKGWRPPAHPRSQTPESRPHETAVQDDHAEADPLADLHRGLVLFSGPERCILSHPDSPPSQTILEIRLWGSGLPVHGPTLWAVSGPPYFYEVHGRGSFPSETDGNPHSQLPRRLAQSEVELLSHRTLILSHLERLGLRVNFAKSALSPSQRVSFLGTVLDSARMRAVIAPERALAIQKLAATFKSDTARPLKVFQRMLGLMAAASPVLQLGLLRMRPLQRWLKPRVPHNAWRHGRLHIRVNQACVTALTPWKNPRWMEKGVAMGLVHTRKVVMTDASNTGWGALCEGKPTFGHWSKAEKGFHINCLEMLAVCRACQFFLPDLIGRHVLIRSDNMSVVSYINHRGGVSSKRFFILAERLLEWAQLNLRSLRAAHLPGRLNQGADMLSRSNVPSEEWMLHPQVVQKIWKIFGKAEVDLFASKDNSHCPIYYSKDRDALAHDWPNLLLYAFPPIALLPQVVRRVREQGHKVLLAFHAPIAGQLVGRDNSVVRFLKGARRLNPPRPLTVPTWDLPTVLRALKGPPFEPLQSTNLRSLSLKTALLLALASVKRVGDLQALSISPACLEFGPNDSKVVLKPRHGYVPKVLSTPFRAQVITLSALPPSEEDRELSLLCPVRALRIYFERSAPFRRTEQLFVGFGNRAKGHPVTKQRLSKWIVDAVMLAYSSLGLQCPIGVRAHSTRGIASSWAWSSGVSITEICAAAGWATPSTFARFYNLDIPALQARVLSA